MGTHVRVKQTVSPDHGEINIFLNGIACNANVNYISTLHTEQILYVCIFNIFIYRP